MSKKQLPSRREMYLQHLKDYDEKYIEPCCFCNGVGCRKCFNTGKTVNELMAWHDIINTVVVSR